MIRFDTQQQKAFVLQCMLHATVDVPHAKAAAEVLEAVHTAAVGEVAPDTPAGSPG